MAHTRGPRRMIRHGGGGRATNAAGRATRAVAKRAAGAGTVQAGGTCAAHVSLVIGLERHDVIIVAALEHLAHRREVDAQGDVAIAAVVVEAIGAQQQRHERDVARVLWSTAGKRRRGREQGRCAQASNGCNRCEERRARRPASRMRWASLTMACSEMPVVEQSKLASVTRSFIASVIFLSMLPCVILA